MKSKQEKNQKLDYLSENLAVPEVHVNNNDSVQDTAEPGDSRDEVVFENLAFPEVKIHKKRKN